MLTLESLLQICSQLNRYKACNLQYAVSVDLGKASRGVVGREIGRGAEIDGLSW